VLLVAPTLLHAGADPRTIRCRQLIAGLPKRGFEVDVLSWWGGEGPPPSPGCRRLHALPSPSPYGAGAHGPEGLGAWIEDAERLGRSLAGTERPALVLGVGLPLAALVAASRIGLALSVPFVADLGDPWEAAGGTRAAERAAVLGSAAALITTTAELARELKRDLGAGTPVLIAPAGGTVRHGGDRGRPPLFVQLGTLTTARVDPVPAYRALGALDAEGAIGFRSHGGAWLDGVESLPHPHLPPLPRDAALELLASADAALVLGNLNREQLPSKAFELACTDVWALCVSALDDDPTVATLWASGHAVEATNDEATIRSAALEIVARVARGERPEPDPAHSWERRLDEIAAFLREV
jgi:hypothetical protein